jgi:hypothetical protein
MTSSSRSNTDASHTIDSQIHKDLTYDTTQWNSVPSGTKEVVDSIRLKRTPSKKCCSIRDMGPFNCYVMPPPRGSANKVWQSVTGEGGLGQRYVMLTLNIMQDKSVKNIQIAWHLVSKTKANKCHSMKIRKQHWVLGHCEFLHKFQSASSNLWSF